MVNKQGLWFLTLFSLILVLSIYYITMPNEIFESEIIEEKGTSQSEENVTEVNSQNTSYIETLKIELDSKRSEELNALQEIINDSAKTSDEKNEAYEQMKEINTIKGIEESIKEKIKENYSLDAYVKQEDDKVEIVVGSKEHDVSLANKIMRTVQESYDTPMSISVKFS